MNIKIHILQIICYFFSSILEKFGITLIIGAIFVASVRWLPLLEEMVLFLHDILPNVFPLMNLESGIHLSSDNNANTIWLLSEIGLPMTTLLLICGFLLDGIRFIFHSTWTLRDYIRKHKIITIVIMCLFCSISMISFILEQEIVIRAGHIVALIFISLVSFMYFFIVAIIPGMILYLYAPLISTIIIAKQTKKS